MKARSAVVGSGVTAAAAVLGNVFVGKEALSWFRGLRAPRFQLPMPGFVSVAAAYYVIMAVVLARGIDRRDAGAIAWAVAVLAGNEAWNGLLFGRQKSPCGLRRRAGVLGAAGRVAAIGLAEQALPLDPVALYDLCDRV